MKYLILPLFVALAGCSEPEAQEANAKDHQVQSSETKTEPAEKPAEKQAVKQEEAPPYMLKRDDLGSGIYMLSGRGGNIGLSVGDDGAFVIDDQFARFSDTILAEIDALSEGPIRFVINTHYHGDHSGSNQEMRDTGADIVAHDNVRVRMSQDNENLFWGRTVEASPAEAWPNITFSQSMTFHFNGQTVEAIHTPRAHTDGDAIIYFREADILHMGDNFFNGMFPYIDVDSGGSVQGMIAALDSGLLIAGENTQIIPGHGPLSSRADMQKTHDILVDIQSRVSAQIDQGANLDEIISSNPLKDYHELASFIDEENMLKITYRSLTGKLN